jgi:glutathione S-transferase
MLRHAPERNASPPKCTAGSLHISAADAFFAPVAYRIRTYGLDVGAGQAWFDRIIAHPAMGQWEAEALAETWREAAHEAELADCGDILSDNCHV